MNSVRWGERTKKYLYSMLGYTKGRLASGQARSPPNPKEKGECATCMVPIKELIVLVTWGILPSGCRILSDAVLTYKWASFSSILNLKTSNGNCESLQPTLLASFLPLRSQPLYVLRKPGINPWSTLGMVKKSGLFSIRGYIIRLKPASETIRV